jgi:hypothetical protein
MFTTLITTGYMKQLTSDQIESIQQMAELFYSYEHICINAEVDPEDHIEDFTEKRGEFYTAYITGFLKGDILLRQSIKQSAENGSHPAQQLLLKLQEEATIEIKANA